MFAWYASLILSFAFMIDVVATRTQGIAVRGRLTCGSEPANQTEVGIGDLDSGFCG